MGSVSYWVDMQKLKQNFSQDFLELIRGGILWIELLCYNWDNINLFKLTESYSKKGQKIRDLSFSEDFSDLQVRLYDNLWLMWPGNGLAKAWQYLLQSFQLLMFDLWDKNIGKCFTEELMKVTSGYSHLSVKNFMVLWNCKWKIISFYLLESSMLCW